MGKALVVALVLLATCSPGGEEPSSRGAFCPEVRARPGRRGLLLGFGRADFHDA